MNYCDTHIYRKQVQTILPDALEWRCWYLLDLLCTLRVYSFSHLSFYDYLLSIRIRIAFPENRLNKHSQRAIFVSMGKQIPWEIIVIIVCVICSAIILFVAFRKVCLHFFWLDNAAMFFSRGFYCSCATKPMTLQKFWGYQSVPRPKLLPKTELVYLGTERKACLKKVPRAKSLLPVYCRRIICVLPKEPRQTRILHKSRQKNLLSLNFVKKKC